VKGYSKDKNWLQPQCDCCHNLCKKTEKSLSNGQCIIKIHLFYLGYYEEGFLALQQAVDNSIITDLNPDYDKKQVDVSLRRSPFPPYNDDLFVIVIQQQLSFVIMVSYVFLALNIVKNVVHEKERKLKVNFLVYFSFVYPKKQVDILSLDLYSNAAGDSLLLDLLL
jgi:hypothetical protein